MGDLRSGPVKELGACRKALLPVSDALEILSGKWKLQIIISLLFGNKRFNQIAKDIPNITDKMLSKELKFLEMNQLIQRNVFDTIPAVVEYSMTEYGKTLEQLICELRDWGQLHRKQILSKGVPALVEPIH